MPERRLVVEHRAEPASAGRRCTHASHAAPVAAAQLHAGDAVALAMHADDGLAEMDAVETRCRRLGEPRERDVQIRDPCGIAIAEKRRADDEQAHLRGDAVRAAHSVPARETAPRTHAAHVRPDDGGAATRPCRRFGLSIRSRGDERAPDLDAIERCQMRVAGEAGHQVERRRQVTTRADARADGCARAR